MIIKARVGTQCLNMFYDFNCDQPPHKKTYDDLEPLLDRFFFGPRLTQKSMRTKIHIKIF